MKKAVVYRRVSTGGQGRSGLGLAAQKKIVRAYCATHHIEIVREFVEVASGRNNKRPKILQAIRYCDTHGLQLIVAKQCRLARSVSFIAALTDRDFDFISVDNPTASKLQKHIQASFDQNMAEETSRNTKLSLAAAKKKGVKFGGNSKKRKKTMRRKYIAYLKKVKPVFKKIKEKVQTVRGIQKELNRRKTKTPRGKKGGWHISTVHKIMHDLSLNK